jgi:hypothetical protein
MCNVHFAQQDLVFEGVPMKRSQWISKLALVFALCGAVAESDRALAGNVTLVRRSTGNSQKIGATGLIEVIPFIESVTVTDEDEADIPDGLPSVIAPLTADGDNSTTHVDGYYQGQLAGTFDHQNVIDHTGESLFHQDFELDYGDGVALGSELQHVWDRVDGDLDVSIDGDGVQFIKVTFEMDWQASGIVTGSTEFDGGAVIWGRYVEISILRNGVFVAGMSTEDSGQLSTQTQNGISHGLETDSRVINGDNSFGNVSTADDFGFWAASGDRITYSISTAHTHYAYLVNPVNPPTDFDAGLVADGLLTWRFAMEDSHVD